MASSYFTTDRKASTSGSPLFSPPASGIPPSPASRGGVNALQSRIATILASSYVDLEISETLKTLDARGITNTPETRRNLRLDLQQELIACNGEVVKDFGEVAAQLRRVGAALDGLNKTCSAIRTHVGAARRETGPVLDEHKALMAQRREAETKQQLLKAFNAHFILPEAELNALTSTAEPVNDQFYSALQRVKQIHSDSQVLLGSSDQTLGLEILETSSRNLDAAYQKLFRWTQRSLKTLDLENPQLTTPIRMAFRVLAERPQLFQSCLDFFATAREQVLSTAFEAALVGTETRGPLSSVPAKAIELSAHEPLRYISDMLAWLHAAAVGEREALAQLFISDASAIDASLRAGRASQPWLASSEKDEVFDGKKALADLVDRDLAGVTRLLRQRVEHTVRSHDDATLSYQVANLCVFYQGIFVPLLGEGTAVVRALEPLGEVAMEQFRLVTRDGIAALRGEIDVGDEEGEVPDWLEEALETLEKLMNSYEGSFSKVTSREEREAGFEDVLREALDPYLEGIENVGRKLDGIDRLVFGLNCFGRVMSTLRGCGFVRGRAEKVGKSLEGLEERATDSVQDWLARESGLAPLFEELRPWLEEEKPFVPAEIRALTVLSPDSLREMATKLDTFLPTSMEDARTYVGNLSDRALARRVCETAADDFVDTFEEVEDLLDRLDEETVRKKQETGNEDGRPTLRDIFPRTAEEIRVLLS